MDLKKGAIVEVASHLYEFLGWQEAMPARLAIVKRYGTDDGQRLFFREQGMMLIKQGSEI